MHKICTLKQLKEDTKIIYRALTCLVGNGVGPIEGDALGLIEGCRVDDCMDLNESEPT